MVIIEGGYSIIHDLLRDLLWDTWLTAVVKKTDDSKITKFVRPIIVKINIIIDTVYNMY